MGLNRQGSAAVEQSPYRLGEVAVAGKEQDYMVRAHLYFVSSSLASSYPCIIIRRVSRTLHSKTY